MLRRATPRELRLIKVHLLTRVPQTLDSGSSSAGRGSAFYRWCVWTGAFVLAGMVLVSCTDTTIDPFSNDQKYFTVYGYLDALETHHKIRVVPVSRLSATITTPLDPQADLDAVVTTTESSFGTVTATKQWRHSLEELEDGTYGHIFTSDFLVREGYTYTLRISRSDGAETVAVTRIPKIDEGLILDRRPFVVNSDSTQITQEIVAPPLIASPWAIQVVYLYSGGGINGREFVPYGRVGEPTPEGGWRFVIDAVADKVAVDAAIVRAIEEGYLEPDDTVVLVSMGVEYRLLDENWNPPGAVFDPEVLAQPGTLSNVTNGYGFFGSVGYFREEWNSEAYSKLLGYD